MNKPCQHCSKTFTLYPEDTDFYKRVNVPEPTRCPDCRKQRRFAFRNEQNFYNRQCDSCQKNIVSVYAPSYPGKVYCLKCWWSDKLDAKDYGRDFDFSQPFFAQYQKLLQDVPAVALMNDNGVQSENCEYTYDFAKGKNSYMIITSWNVENSMYGLEVNQTKELMDCCDVNHSELVYESVVVENCYNGRYNYYSRNINNCMFIFDLQGCSDCLFCTGLRNKQYCIWNKQYSKEDYEKKKLELDFSSYHNIQKYIKIFDEFIIKTPRRFAYLYKCQNSTGDILTRCHDCFNCFIYSDLINCRYMHFGDTGRDSMDVDHSGNPELCYESITPDDSYNNMFTIFVWKSKFVSYSENCHSSSDLFGCVGLKRQKKCILNKQYSDADYKKLKSQIIAHMQATGEYGEFFPLNISPFAYNESLANDFYPLSKAEVMQKGLYYSENLPQVTGKETIKTEDIPDQIINITEEICQKVLICKECSRNYKIIKQEYNYYKQHDIPLPRECMYCRYKKRMTKVNQANLWHRQCDCTQPDHGHAGRCTNEFETTYSPDRKELVYCEDCYRKEIY
ncbi:MAG: zinc-ribbon domain containing protein [Patescibacteria group bacterium]